MEKFHVFCGWDYYPNGGIHDLKFSGAFEDCLIFLRNNFYYWYHITDENLVIVKEGTIRDFEN